MLVAPTQRQVLRDLTESDGRFAVDNRLHYYWSEKREAETLLLFTPRVKKPGILLGFHQQERFVARVYRTL